MDIFQTIKSKVLELGDDEVCKLLEVTPARLAGWLKEKAKPDYETCQKVVNFWMTEIQSDSKPLWEGRDVCLCLPIYKFPAPEMVFSVMAMWDRSRMRMEMRYDDSMIARSRNQLAKRFLKTDCAWSIWFDDDMIFPFGNAGIFLTMSRMDLPFKFANLHTIDRLLSWGKTMVGGCYWDRKGRGGMIAGGKVPIINLIPSDNLQPVDFVGTGCLAIHRQVFEDIAKKFPDVMTGEEYGNESGFFTPIQSKHRMLGEDESFAWRATEAGHPSYLDLGLICGHIGAAIHGIPKPPHKR